MEISGRTGLLGLIGSPVGHSGSPAMYNYSFEILDLDYKYLAFDIPVEKTEDAVNAFRTFNMKGGNVTMPCKGEVAKYMDELSPASRIIGACNTIINKDGKLIGDITDGKGYVRNLFQFADVAGPGVQHQLLPRRIVQTQGRLPVLLDRKSVV